MFRDPFSGRGVSIFAKAASLGLYPSQGSSSWVASLRPLLGMQPPPPQGEEGWEEAQGSEVLSDPKATMTGKDWRENEEAGLPLLPGTYLPHIRRELVV